MDGVDCLFNEIGKGNPRIHFNKYLLYLGLTSKTEWLKSSGFKQIFIDAKEKFWQSD